MSFPYLVKQRPVCVGCGKKCGEHYKAYPPNQLHASEWDGQTWFWKYNPFCTLRCALAYARRSYVAGVALSARAARRAS